MAEITEAKIYAALGIQAPEGEQGQAVAAPAAETPESSQAQEGAADIPSTDTPTPEPDNPDSGSGSGDQPMSQQQRRENAARRRQQEQQAAVNAAVEQAVAAEREKHNQQIQAFFAQAGLKNATTGQPITSMEEFAQWQEQHTAAQLQRDLKAGKLTPELLRQAMDSHPVIQQARQLLAQQEAAAAAQQEAADKARIDAEIARIHAIDPSIESVADLLNMPNAEQFRAYVAKGYSFEDAYYLLNRQRIEQQTAEAARQQALNSSRSKDHLQSVGNSRATIQQAVPADVMAMYRRINPKATPEQIIKHYNKHLNG